MKLLCRLYDPTEGQILLDGVDIRDYDYRQYMQQFAPVFQDFKLFSFTIDENIAFANPDKGNHRFRIKYHLHKQIWNNLKL
ncbi:ATP-binding cassette domain-containing protein [Butyrivibrio sp. YAB3001]|uniref:ATP-binding cassette domain-containing protein n=1 Tax=Butyrivibrio sp. YAB3001 TaxID=1520812 RepID=UPI000B8061D6